MSSRYVGQRRQSVGDPVARNAEQDVGEGRRQVRQPHQLGVGLHSVHAAASASVMRLRPRRAASSGFST